MTPKQVINQASLISCVIPMLGWCNLHQIKSFISPNWHMEHPCWPEQWKKTPLSHAMKFWLVNCYPGLVVTAPAKNHYNSQPINRSKFNGSWIIQMAQWFTIRFTKTPSTMHIIHQFPTSINISLWVQNLVPDPTDHSYSGSSFL